MVGGRYFDTIISVEAMDATNSRNEANGDWVAQPAGATISQPGRAEVNSAGQKHPSANGDLVDFSFMIYLPLDAKAVVYGSEVIIKNSAGEQIGKGTAKGFKRNLMNAKLWV